MSTFFLTLKRSLSRGTKIRAPCRHVRYLNIPISYSELAILRGRFWDKPYSNPGSFFNRKYYVRILSYLHNRHARILGNPEVDYPRDSPSFPKGWGGRENSKALKMFSVEQQRQKKARGTRGGGWSLSLTLKTKLCL